MLPLVVLVVVVVLLLLLLLPVLLDLPARWLLLLVPT
jgi:hypothetical protein